MSKSKKTLIAIVVLLMIGGLMKLFHLEPPKSTDPRITRLQQTIQKGDLKTSLLLAKTYKTLPDATISNYAGKIYDSLNGLMADLRKDPAYRLKDLLDSFSSFHDDFDGSTRYEYLYADSHFGYPGINVIVTPDGGYILSSFYRGQQSIHHSKIAVRVGDKVYYSTIAPKEQRMEFESSGTTSYRHRFFNQGLFKRRYFSTVNYEIKKELDYYTGGDGGITKAIAEAPDSTVIAIRFLGDGAYRDMTLSHDDIQGVKRSYELAQLFKEKK